jgi:hypothetical protein
MGVWKYQGSPINPAQLQPDTPRFDTGLGIITQGIINPSYDILELFREGDKMKYKDFKYGGQISADYGTVDNYFIRGEVQPVAPSVTDLGTALEWVALYDCGDDKELAQSLANVVAFLDFTIQAKEKRSNLAKAKKEYAKAHGIPVSQVRIKKNN